VRLEGLGQLRKNPSHRDSNPLPSGLQHSASTNYATADSFTFFYVIRRYIIYMLTASFYNSPMADFVNVCEFRVNTCDEVLGKLGSF
jgi:hypothetical protein